MSQVRGEKKLEFFYELGLKGKGLENAQKNENYTADKKRAKSPLEVENGSPNRKELHKEIFSGMKKEDRVDKAIKERMAAGNYLTVVPNAETHQALLKTINLKLNKDYQLRENPKNKEMQKHFQREMQPAL